MTYRIRVTLGGSGMGIHARPSAHLVRSIIDVNADVFMTRPTWTMNVDGKNISSSEKEERRVNAKSIMGLLTLVICKGETFEITCQGEEAKQAVERLRELFTSEPEGEGHFGGSTFEVIDQQPEDDPGD